VKCPVAYKRGPKPEPSSKTCKSRTTLLKPVPTVAQLVPFHFATLFTETLPPASENWPPA
jgi:hypothetical protein